MAKWWHRLFLACGPLALLLVLNGQWAAAAIVWFLALPLFWLLRNRSATQGVASDGQPGGSGADSPLVVPIETLPEEVFLPGVGATDWQIYLATINESDRIAAIQSAHAELYLSDQRLAVWLPYKGVTGLLNLVDVLEVRVGKLPGKLVSAGEIMLEVTYMHGAERRVSQWGIQPARTAHQLADELESRVAARRAAAKSQPTNHPYYDLTRHDVVQEHLDNAHVTVEHEAWLSTQDLVSAHRRLHEEMEKGSGRLATTGEIADAPLPIGVSGPPRAKALLMGIGTERWEGVAEAWEEGLIITGERIWTGWDSEDDPRGDYEHRDSGQVLLEWDFESAIFNADGECVLEPSDFRYVTLFLSEFDQRGFEPWLTKLSENGAEMTAPGRWRRSRPWPGPSSGPRPLTTD